MSLNLVKFVQNIKEDTLSLNFIVADMGDIARRMRFISNAWCNCFGQLCFFTHTQYPLIDILKVAFKKNYIKLSSSSITHVVYLINKILWIMF